ncbi:NAD(P)/FAD-dependent oxidoreductase [Ancylobacter mangrovi]|uniref:NAD(P)/FAD-dependent oxidoreductase n=1 Tax=Ancylobacter mangrovi TaxID=2972472 RepID=UPI0021637707|nr:FAD-dependent oxidoreductase [Ancylobacter mangrovi]MCS0502834.1 FAD-binding oxidoreductase [Ancylobacter mangrovi]
MSSDRQSDVVIVGAGIVGLCAGLLLQRAGRSVTIADPLPPGTATSYGNAGLLSAGTNMPAALPGIWRNVPKWLLDRQGPLAVRYSYLPKAAPWLAKWILASGTSTVHAASDALRALHKDTMDAYREVLGPEPFADLIRTEGSLNVFYNDAPGRNELFIRHLIARHGIAIDELDHADLKEMMPEIGPIAQRGLFFPHNGWTVNPSRLAATVARLFTEAGGRMVSQKVLSVRPMEGGIELFGNLGDWRADTVILAAGAWTGRLLHPLGVKLPMETERGYHLMLEDANISPRLPLLLRDGGLAITPMEEGLRLAGTVEIAGLDAPPDEKRARQLLDRARQVFPTLRSASYRKWLGFRPSLPDSVAAIGPVPGMRGLFVAAGHGHTGIVGASTTARLVRDLVTGAAPVIDPAPYSLTRFNRGGR